MQERKIKVGVLRGGDGPHYDQSVKDGAEIISFILNRLPFDYTPVDILVDREGVWHVAGLPVLPADLIHKVDIVWNVSNPTYSTSLRDLGIHVIGANIFPFGLHTSKGMLREHMKQIGVKVPQSLVIPLYQSDFDGEDKEKYVLKKAREVHAKFSAPWIVKSFTESSMTGIHVARTFPELITALTDIVDHGKSILVEEFISGKVARVHSVKGVRGEELYSFVPHELKHGFFTHNTLMQDEKEKLTNLAKQIHEHTGAGSYTSSTFILNPTRGIHLAEISFIPDLNQDSHFCKSCETVGLKSSHVVDHIIEKGLSE